MKIDPLGRYCQCGHYWYFGKLDYIRMILFGKITVRCPQCNTLHQYRLIYHAIEDFTDTRMPNKQMENNKKRMWKNG